MSEPWPIITIDGPTASGKSVLAAHLAMEYQLAHLQAFNFFRMMGYWGLQGHNRESLLAKARCIRPSDMFAWLGAEYRHEGVAKVAITLRDDREVKTAFREVCRQAYDSLPANCFGLVADGRPLGNEIFNDGRYNAGLKIFLTAHEDERARRMAVREESVNIGDVKERLRRRDGSDLSGRFLRLTAAPDAIIIDTTHMGIQRTIEVAADYISRRFPDLKRVDPPAASATSKKCAL